MFGKPSEFAGEYVHYYSRDPAFNAKSKKFNHAKWLETKGDEHLPRIADQSPFRFTLERLSSRAWVYVQDMAARVGPSTGAWIGVALALREVSPCMGDDDEDAELVLVTENKLRRLCDEDMDRIAKVHDGALVGELFDRIAKESKHNPLSSKASG